MRDLGLARRIRIVSLELGVTGGLLPTRSNLEGTIVSASIGYLLTVAETCLYLNLRDGVRENGFFCSYEIFVYKPSDEHEKRRRKLATQIVSACHGNHNTTKQARNTTHKKVLSTGESEGKNNMIFRSSTLALLLLVGSDAILRGTKRDNHRDLKKRRQLTMDGGGGGDNRDDDPCKAEVVAETLILFGYNQTDPDFAELVDSAVASCLAGAAVRDDECLCYDEAVVWSGINSLTTQDPNGRRRLEVLPEGQWCESNEECRLEHPDNWCMIGPYIWICTTPAARPGALRLCDQGESKCVPLPP